jgi:arsenate reductase
MTDPASPETGDGTDGGPDRPSVLFVCVHNAGRSQMAAAWLAELSGGQVEIRSAGTTPADEVNPVVVQAMAEVGIDLSTATPTVLSDRDVRASDVVVTMGCGDTCPFYPGVRYLDWPVDDPAGQGLDEVRRIRDVVRGRVEVLLGELMPGEGEFAGTGTGGQLDG